MESIMKDESKKVFGDNLDWVELKMKIIGKRVAKRDSLSDVSLCNRLLSCASEEVGAGTSWNEGRAQLHQEIYEVWDDVSVTIDKIYSKFKQLRSQDRLRKKDTRQIIVTVNEAIELSERIEKEQDWGKFYDLCHESHLMAEQLEKLNSRLSSSRFTRPALA
jgi:hypothetical protein